MSRIVPEIAERLESNKIPNVTSL